MLPVVTGYPNSDKNLYNFTPNHQFTLHHFIIFTGGLEAKKAICYKFPYVVS